MSSKVGSKGTKFTETESLHGPLNQFAESPPVSVAFIDIDDFKAINDSHGHSTGDLILEAVVKDLTTATGPEGIVARVGGDAFACLMPATPPEQALLRLDRARANLEKKRTYGKVKLSVPISFGIASFPHHTEDPTDLIGQASDAMEKAKREGRNRGAIYIEERMVLKSNYYPRAQLGRLASLATSLGRTEAALLREALADLEYKYRDVT